MPEMPSPIKIVAKAAPITASVGCGGSATDVPSVRDLSWG
jgi:hypothetical protein